MNLRPYALLLAFLPASAPVAAATFSSGDWEAARIGGTCLVYTNAAARDTSGSLQFSFDAKGYNAGFSYEYAPYTDNEEDPWSETDLVEITIDGEDIWLGEEMFPVGQSDPNSLAMTGGFVKEMIAVVANAERTVDISVERESLGETWLYGRFSPVGFKESLAKAAEMCDFNPASLPES
ncbi:hypothetical protein [Roseibium sediminicola]|uniref:Uncharacterized protein n=1 Tax=Roseibium sediminicola TaxID=2933272 RepID=A0ABT0GY76_9HYPH|nr:hypothetical protein [Roseibium sp. CAU 1639]MCK7613768.1 hypothetical protein [Roseibium sp. CAU 1639]